MARCDKCAHSVFAVDSSLLKKKGCFLRSWRGEKAILNTDVARLPLGGQQDAACFDEWELQRKRNKIPGSIPVPSLSVLVPFC